MTARYGIVVFPGTWSDTDWRDAVVVLGAESEYVFHKETDVSRFDCLIIPGGFSYGDYLRPGAIARFSPVMGAVVDFANAGGPVLGSCNGFQVLCESGLLPGALMRNASLEFRCQPQHLLVERAAAPFTSLAHQGDVLSIPVSHGDGKLLRRRRDTHADGGEWADIVPLLCGRRAGNAGCQPERLAGEYRGRHERGGERAGADAASGACGRGSVGSGDGRPEDSCAR